MTAENGDRGDGEGDEKSKALVPARLPGALLSPEDEQRLHAQLDIQVEQAVKMVRGALDDDSRAEVRAQLVNSLIDSGMDVVIEHLLDLEQVRRKARTRVRNRILNARKRDKKFIEADDDSLQDRATQASYMMDPHQRLEDAEMRAIIRGAVDELPDDLNAVITLIFDHEQSYKAVAAMLNRPVGKVKSARAKAMEVLRAKLSAVGLGPRKAVPSRRGSPVALPRTTSESRQRQSRGGN